MENRLPVESSYRTAETEHFVLHYPAELEELAAQFASIAEPVYERVTKALRYRLDGKTHLVLGERSNRPVTFTFIYPHRQIFLDVALPPEQMGLNEYASWHEWLLTHEFAHVVHMEMRGGPYKPLSAVAGAWLRPNSWLPAWVKERGGRVSGNLAHSPRKSKKLHLPDDAAGGGRGRPARIRSLRAPGLDIGSFLPSHWPWGTRPYLFGTELMTTLEQLRPGGIATLSNLTARAGPYGLEKSLARMGLPLEVLWTKTLERVRRRAQVELRQLRRDPLTSLEYLTHDGFHRAGWRSPPMVSGWFHPRSSGGGQRHLGPGPERRFVSRALAGWWNAMKGRWRASQPPAVFWFSMRCLEPTPS